MPRATSSHGEPASAKPAAFGSATTAPAVE